MGGKESKTEENKSTNTGNAIVTITDIHNEISMIIYGVLMIALILLAIKLYQLFAKCMKKKYVQRQTPL